MKYLSDYTQEKQTKLFDDLGVFFAFGKKQFDEGKKKGVKYCDVDCGMICPVGNEKKLMEGLKKIFEVAVKQDIKENGKKGIIKRELSNHEYYYTRELDQTVEALEGYNFTVEEIKEVAHEIEEELRNLNQ